MKCSQCGKEIVDPYCEEACPKKLCQECGEKCCEIPRDEPLPEACEDCPYEAEPDVEEDDRYYCF